MRIAILNEKFYPALGGIENYIYCVSQDLIALGHEVIVICQQHTPTLPIKENIDGIEVLRHPPFVVNLPRIARGVVSIFSGCAYSIRRLTKFLEEIPHDVDAVWARHPFYACAACRALSHKPVLYIQASSFPTHLRYIYRALPTWKKWIYGTLVIPQVKWIEQGAMSACDRIVVLSDFMRQELAEHYKVSISDVAVVPPGIKLERFAPGRPDTDLLEELNIDADQHVLLTVCRLSPEKNVQFLINAFCATKTTRAVLLIVGDGTERTKLEQLACANPRIRFLGYRRDVWRFYSIADAFVLPSVYEPFGQVLLEAMASGCPCIALAPSSKTRVASNEIIEEGVTGYLVDSSSADELADRIERLVNDESLCRQMGARAREACEQKYSWSWTTQRLLELSGFSAT